MSRRSGKLAAIVVAAIQQETGVVSKSAGLTAIIAPLAKAATQDRLRKRIAYLEQAVAALAPAEPPRMPGVPVRPLNQRDHAEWMDIVGHLGEQR